MSHDSIQNSSHTMRPGCARLRLHARTALMLCACLAPLASFARLGENADELEKRYGKPTRELTESNLTYRVFRFRNREVEVILLDGQSANEFINLAPREVYGREDARKVVEETKTLVDGILTVGYAFPQEEADAFWQALAPVSREQTEEAEVTRYRAARRVGEIDVSLVLNESHATDFAQTIRFEGFVSLRAVRDADKDLAARVQSLLNAAARQQQDAAQADAAEGF